MIKYRTRNNGGFSVMTPYRDKAVAARRASLKPVSSSLDGEVIFFLSIVIGIASLAVGFIVGTIVEPVSDQMDVSTALLTWAGLLSLYLSVLGAHGLRLQHRRAQACVVDRDEAHEWVRVAANSKIELLAKRLLELDPETREEMRPVWDEAVRANAFLLEVGTDEKVERRITDRVEAVTTLIVERGELEQALRLERARENFGDANDDDLALAQAHAQALKAGREAHQALNTPA